MLRLHARNPILITIAAATIVVAAFAVMAPRFALQRYGSQDFQNVSVEHVMVAPPPNAAPTAPKLSVRIANPSSRSFGGSSQSITQPLIAKTAKVELLVANVDAVADAVATVAQSAGGDTFDLTAQGSSSDRSSQTADMTIRIPASRFDGAMAHLERLGTVRSRSVKAEDLTASVTDSSARLRNLERTESDILKIMDRSGNVSQIMDVENQLSDVREQIETLQADVASMRGRVAYSTIEVQLEAEAKGSPGEPSALARLGNAFAAATRSLADTTIALLAVLIWLVVFVPYVLAIAAIMWALRTFVRRLRPRLLR